MIVVRYPTLYMVSQPNHELTLNTTGCDSKLKRVGVKREREYKREREN